MLLICASIGATLVRLTAASDSDDRVPRTPSPASTAPDASTAAADVLSMRAAPRRWHSIVLHHSATAGGDVASIDAAHRRQKDRDGKPWLGIGYHFVVGNGQKMGDGEIQSTFRWRDQLPGAHAGQHEYNEHGIGICLIGNFEQAAPSAKQLAAARQLVKRLADRYAIPRTSIVSHRDVQATACPGRLFTPASVVADVSAPAGGT